MEPELFETKITDQGKDLLTRINSWARVFYIATVISGVFDLVIAGLSLHFYIKYTPSITGGPTLIQLFNLGYLALYAVLLPITGYFLYRFSVGSKKALIASDTIEWNDSLKWLLKHSRIAAILFIVNSIWAITNAVSYFILIRNLNM